MHLVYTELAPAVEAICARAGITISDVPTAAPTNSNSSASRTGTASVTGSATGTAASQSTGAAVANLADVGVIALGLVAVFGL